MKKLFSILAAALLITGIAFADFNGPSANPAQGFHSKQGFKGKSAASSISSIKDVLGMYDDQIAVIKGNIVNQISDDKYLFRDKSGEMVVEIDYKYWNGLEVTEEDVLELTGKVDKDYNGVTLDVFRVEKAK